MRVRVSLGTAAVLGLCRCRLDAEPTTAYLMLYHEGRCRANCGFCPQARESTSRLDMLSRVVWPPYELGDVVEALSESTKLKRICVQAVNYPGFWSDLVQVVSELSDTGLPMSVCCQPVGREMVWELRDLGVERVGIPVDAATPGLFDVVKGSSAGGPYTWSGHMEALREALEVFGRWMVSTHLIVGLGETELEAVEFIQNMADMGVLTGLFAFTPVRGTRLEGLGRPDLRSYRRIQLAHTLIYKGLSSLDRMEFDGRGHIACFGVDRELLLDLALSGEPFMTKGCPGCNRPFYNERPGGPMYNYPYRPSREEALREASLLGLLDDAA